jgi:hypothetical protein
VHHATAANGNQDVFVAPALRTGLGAKEGAMSQLRNYDPFPPRLPSTVPASIGFVLEKASAPGKLVFSRAITSKDTSAKESQKQREMRINPCKIYFGKPKAAKSFPQLKLLSKAKTNLSNTLKL